MVAGAIAPLLLFLTLDTLSYFVKTLTCHAFKVLSRLPSKLGILVQSFLPLAVSVSTELQ